MQGPKILTDSGRLATRLMELLGDSNLMTCLGCGSCSNVCPVSERGGMDPWRLVQSIIKGLDEDALNTNWLWSCSLCGMCESVCPMGINIPQIILILRAFQGQDFIPKELERGIFSQACFSNSENITPRHYRLLVEKAQGLYRQRSKQADFEIPIDRKGANLLLLMDPMLLKEKPEMLADYCMLFGLLEENWTITSLPFSSADITIHTKDSGNEDLWVKRLTLICKELGIQRCLIDDCFNCLSSKAIKKWAGFNEQANIEIVTSLDLVAEGFKRGRFAKLKKLKGPVTLQEPCLLLEGASVFDEYGAILDAMFSDLKEMVKPSENSVCCGGSLLRAGIANPLRSYELAKAKQIKGSCAKALLTFCATCFLQLSRLVGKENMDVSILFFPEAAVRFIKSQNHSSSVLFNPTRFCE